MEDLLTIQRAHDLCDVGRPADAAALVAPLLGGGGPPALEAFARAMLLLDNHAEALRAAREAIALTPDRARPYVLASEALRRLKRLPEAVDTAEQAIRLDPEQPVGYQLLAMALLAGRGRRRRAWAAAQTAVRLGPMEPAFLITCARAAAARGRRGQARRLLHDALRLDPLHPGTHHALATLSSDGAPAAMADAAAGFRTALRIDPRQEASRTGLDLVLRRSLIRVAYLLLAVAAIALRLTQAGLPGPARVAAVLAIAVPAGFAARFVSRLDDNLRGYLRTIAFQGRQRAALVAEGLAAVLLLGAAVAPGPGPLFGAAGAALVARILVESETNRYRSSRGLGTRYVLSSVTLWFAAGGLAFIGLLGLATAVTGGPAAGLGIAAVCGLLAAVTVRAALRR